MCSMLDGQRTRYHPLILGSSIQGNKQSNPLNCSNRTRAQEREIKIPYWKRKDHFLRLKPQETVMGKTWID